MQRAVKNMLCILDIFFTALLFYGNINMNYCIHGFTIICNYFLPFNNNLPIIVIAIKWDKVGILIYRSINTDNSFEKSHKCSLKNEQKKPKKLINIHFKKGYFTFMLNCIKWAIA
jgi:hypothetical protein